MEKEELINIISYSVQHHEIAPGFFDYLYEEVKDSIILTEIIKEKFDFILSAFPNNSFFSLVLEELSCYDDMHSHIVKNIPIVLKYFHGDLDNLSTFSIQEYVNSHFSELVSYIPKDTFFAMAISDYYVQEKNRNLLNQYLMDYKKDYVSFLLGKKLSLSYSDTQLDTLMDVLVMLVDELLKHEELSYVDIKLLSAGSFSDVIEIGSKVVKVGDERYTYFMPNSPYFLAPLIRVNLEDISFLKGTIEVVEKVDTDIHISESELYELYRLIRLDKQIWLDVKKENVGRLLCDNTIHYKKTLYPDSITRGLLGENTTVLKKGDYVVCDLDHLVFEEVFQNDFGLRQNFYLSNAYDFEEKYQKSKIKND